MEFDFLDVMGITTLLDWGREKFGIEKKEVKDIQQPLSPRKFIYRPTTFDEYISQDKAKDKVKLTIELIKKGFIRHFLFTGNAGHGKTTLAGIVAQELGFKFNVYVGSNFDKDTMLDFAIKNEKSDLPNILFIDEIAELDKKTLTYMLPIIEDFKLDGIEIRKFFLIGATTDEFIISKRCQPFLDRIHCKLRLEDYSAEDIKRLLIQYNDQIHRANISTELYDILSRNVRFNPRLAVSVFDYLIAVNGDIDRVLKMNRIIKDGLDDIDIKILEALNSTNDRPVGETTLSIIANMTRQEYKELREPYLVRQKFISVSSRGRILTTEGKIFLQSLR